MSGKVSAPSSRRPTSDVVRRPSSGNFLPNIWGYYFLQCELVRSKPHDYTYSEFCSGCENHFWIMGVYFESKYSFTRKFLSKMFTLATILDDMYDAHGTLDELQLFIDALQQWDVTDIDFYKALVEVYDEIKEELANKGHLYRLHYAKEAMKMQGGVYLAKVKWLHQKYTPTIEEYSDLTAATIAVPMLVMHSLVGMDDVVTKDTCEWLSSYPKILKSASVACRYMNDIAGYKFERTRDHIHSSICCLVKQYGYTDQEAEEELKQMVSDTWKDTNEASLRPFTVPESVLRVILNFIRSCCVIYEDTENFTRCTTKMKDYIKALLIDPLLL